VKLSDLTPAERERVAVAFHEAGHAVAGVLAGGRVEVAEVYATVHNGEHGRVTLTGLPADGERATAYSGPWGQARWKFGPRPRIDQVRAVLASTGSCDHAALIAAGGGLPREVEPMLEVVWPAVRELAAVLFRDGRAGHDAVLAALGAASDADIPLIKSMVKAKVWTPGMKVGAS